MPHSVNIQDLDFSYPEALVATERRSLSRIMSVLDGEPCELSSKDELFARFKHGDVLVINDTRVLSRRVFSESGLEILFLAPLDSEACRWQVLCPSSRWKSGTKEILPEGVELELIERGRIQVVVASKSLPETYFEQVGEMPLPPYIQKARGERRNRREDRERYQTAWAKENGSLAAPTASLHFTEDDLNKLKSKGVATHSITLHVGLGTFLPISVDNLEEHVMHAEVVTIPGPTWIKIQDVRASGGHVWALGTTVTRALESVGENLLAPTPDGGYSGATTLFIRPGRHQWRVVDRLLTNFHQPRSTLLALVGAFAGLERVKTSYAWAIERGFRLFSYGDLSVWSR